MDITDLKIYITVIMPKTRILTIKLRKWYRAWHVGNNINTMIMCKPRIRVDMHIYDRAWSTGSKDPTANTSVAMVHVMPVGLLPNQHRWARCKIETQVEIHP